MSEPSSSQSYWHFSHFQQHFAADISCPEHFAKGQAPDLVNEKLSTKTKDICYSGFALIHSGVARTPLYSADTSQEIA